MTRELYACIHVSGLPTQTLLRLHPELRSVPVAILEDQPPHQVICSINRAARSAGAVLGMTKLEAEAVPSLRLMQRSIAGEAAARSVLLECAASFSPRIEDAAPLTGADTVCAIVLDISGTERLFGPPATLAARLRVALGAAGFRASIAVSSNFHTARLKAATATGITVIPTGNEARALAKLPLSALNLNEDDALTFANWGVRTLGELAALPQVDLVTRLGERILASHSLARGVLSHTFQPIEPSFSLEEFCDFETPVEQADSLLFIAARMIDCLIARATSHALCIASLTMRMALGGGRIHQRVIRPALLQLDPAASPPHAAVLSLTLSAQPGQSSKVQLGLFTPQTPEPTRLDVTIARLKAIAGADRVGSPVLEDSHRSGAFRMANFAPGSGSATTHQAQPRMALRRMRPPAPIRVVLDDRKPAVFHDRERSFDIEAAYGPWKTSGCWWREDGWNAEEWDVLAQAGGDTLACLLVHDCTRDQWRLEAFYD